jgi:hypothetical protein
VDIDYAWRGEFSNAEVNELHAVCFETRVFDESEWNWSELVQRYSLGWVVARGTGSSMPGSRTRWSRRTHATVGSHHNS